MAHSRPDSPILEQPRRRWLWLALSAGLILLAAGSGFLLRGAHEKKPVNHAFAVPLASAFLLLALAGAARVIVDYRSLGQSWRYS